MKNIDEYLAKVKQILAQDKEPENIADELEAMEYSFDLPDKTQSKLYLNYATLGDCVGWFCFNWREESYGKQQDEDKFLTEGLADIRQMIQDIDENNIYHPTFKVKSVYTDSKWRGKSRMQKINATDVEAAKKQTDEIRANSPKLLPDKPDLTLSDVILFMNVMDSHNKKRYEQKIEPEYGAYFEPREK